MIIYDDGRWVDVSQATHAHSLGLTRGVALFNTLRTYQGNVVFLKPSVDRLVTMAAEIGLLLNGNDLEMIIHTAAQKNYVGNHELSIRIIVSPGHGQTLLLEDRGTPSIYVLVEQIRPLSMKESAVSLKTVPFFRQAAHLKHTNYFAAYLALGQAKHEGYDDILYTDGATNPRLIEASRNNIVFISSQGEMILPKHDAYDGMVRHMMMRLAEKRAIPFVQRDCLGSELDHIHAVFITGITYGPRAVKAINKQTFQSAKHPIFKAAQQYYEQCIVSNEIQ